MLKNLWIASLVAALLVAASGLNFVSSYDISSTRINVIEASIIQISHTRYLIAAVLLLISAICFASFEILRSIKAATDMKTVVDPSHQESM